MNSFIIILTYFDYYKLRLHFQITTKFLFAYTMSLQTWSKEVSVPLILNSGSIPMMCLAMAICEAKNVFGITKT